VYLQGVVARHNYTSNKRTQPNFVAVYDRVKRPVLFCSCSAASRFCKKKCESDVTLVHKKCSASDFTACSLLVFNSKSS